MREEQKDKEVELLKTQIGFGTAFKATLGFYAAQFVATTVGLAILAVIGTIVFFGIAYLTR